MTTDAPQPAYGPILKVADLGKGETREFLMNSGSWNCANCG
jgi:hypothetical protein